MKKSIFFSLLCSAFCARAGNLTLMSSIKTPPDIKIEKVQVTLVDRADHVMHYDLQNFGAALNIDSPKTDYSIQFYEEYRLGQEKRTWVTGCADPWLSVQAEEEDLFDPKANYQVNFMQNAKTIAEHPNCYVVKTK